MADDKKKDAKKAGDKKGNGRMPSALKRDIQGEKRNLRNRAYRAKVRTAVVSLESSMNESGADAAVKTKLSDLFSLMDKGVKKGVFKKNKADRTKSRFYARTLKKA
jgi:small subunit ribosomal protein S20